VRILTELRASRRMFATCPNCDEDVQLSDAQLFDATRKLPECAKSYLLEQESEIATERAELRSRSRDAREHPGVMAEAVGIGNVVEKIAPSLPGFPVASRDCRSLFQPIDYVVFNGLSSRGRIDSVTFVDVKSGNSQLTRLQSRIRTLVEAGNIRFLIADCSAGPRP
jgi:predicted Holliday junction resolvase-like endonuclease